MKQIVLLGLLAFALALTTACPASNDAYGTAAKTELTITDVIHTAADSMHELQVNGTITVEDAREGLTALQSLNSLDLDASVCTSKVHTAGGDNASAYAACADTFLTRIQDPAFIGSLHIKNQTVIDTIRSTASSIATLLKTTMQSLSAMKPAAGKP